jgi:hypothetical protein
MHNRLIAVIDSLFAFVSKHAGDPLNPSTFLTQDQIRELTTLDAEFYAYCQLHGLSLPVIQEPNDDNFRCFGNSRLPYIFCTLHLPINANQEMVGGGMVLMPTAEWKHALTSLRATAQVLETRTRESGKMGSPSAPAAFEDPGASAGTILDKHEDGPAAGRKSVKRKRGRPAGGKTKEKDSKLYSDWKAARRETGLTKAEFLRERGLPESDLAAIERGRKQRNDTKEPGKK